MLPPADAETPGQPGDRSRPPLLATATPAAVTALAGAAPAGAAGANRPTITDPAAPTAATTSAHPDPAASGIATSTPAATRTEMNQIRTASNRAAILRNQPRTVDAGTPDTTAIRRCPAPPALATTAAQINSRGISVRLDAIDALETHFDDDHQELAGATAARDALLAQLGFTGITFSPTPRTTSTTPTRTPSAVMFCPTASTPTAG